MSRAAHRLLRPVAVLVAFVLAGVLLGVVWVELAWTAPQGEVAGGTWYPADERSLSRETAGTSTYVVLALVGGLLLGLLAALVAAGRELLVLGAVVLGSAAAAGLMWWVGTALGPPDPTTIAPQVPDGTTLPGDLSVSGLSPFLTLPTAALTALVAVFVASPGDVRRPSRR